MNKPRKAVGDTIKSISDNRIGGYLVRFTNKEDRDLHGDWFSKDTEFYLETGYPVKGDRILFEHGFDDVTKVMPIGLFDFVDMRDVGLWVEGKLNDREEYERMLRKLRDSGKVKMADSEITKKAELAASAIKAMVSTGTIQWSSGALPQGVAVDEETRHIKTWPIIEGTVTHTPAEPDGTEIRMIKSAFSELKELLDHQPSIQPAQAQKDGIGHESVRADNVEPNPAANPATTTTSTSQTDVDHTTIETNGENNMDIQAIVDVLSGLIADLQEQAEEMGVPEEEADKMAQEAVDATVAEETAKAEDDDEDEEMDDEQKAVELGKSAFRNLLSLVENHKKAAKSAKSAFAAQRKEWQMAQAGTGGLPPYSHSRNGGNGQISVGENLKYAHLSATDMAMAWKMAVSSNPFGRLPQGMAGRKATDFVTEEFYRNAMHKMAKHVDGTKFSRAEDSVYVKSLTPFKANELNASDITGQGLEYLGNVYDTMVWETARNNRIYQLMLSRGMMEKQVPQGMKNAIVPIEGDDPSVYGGVEGNSTDATGRPEVVYKITPQTTSTTTVTPGTFRTATAYTFELGEDSFVDMASEANRKVNLALEEHIEKAMINGDTETAASTNINDIAGAPTSTGLTRDYFLEFDGIRKSPLVTSTAYARSGGTLAVDDYRRTWALLGSNIAPRKDKIFFLIDFDTFQASLDLLPTLTRDVAGEGAALFTGEFDDLWGLPIYMSGFLAKSNTAGKIDLDTTANNTKGQIIAAYAPYWAFVFKRNITIEMQRSPDSETFEFYGSMRFSLKRRSAAAAAITYNLTV